MRPNATSKRSWLAVWCLALASGCGQDLNVGSDVLFTSRFEYGGSSFPEWRSVGGGANAYTPAGDTIEVSSDEFHPPGKFAAKLTVTGTAGNTAGNGASFVLNGGLPSQAYYSSWYYLPSYVTVGLYWVIMKFRMSDLAGNPAELFDVNLKNANGGMSLRVWDHQTGTDLPLVGTDASTDGPNIPVEEWFQLEAFYRDAFDNSGRFTLWLDGQKIVDYPGATGPTPWVAWDVVSVGDNLTPEPAILYVDDCAISKSRVGPTGLIAK